MQNLYFKQYRQDVVKLSRSMIIKFNDIALQVNQELIRDNYEIDPDPTTWKYYLNLNGQHHESDSKMYVKSSDTLEVIEFNKANLKLHLATLREFYPGSYQYRNLVNRFPDQESLIRGILYPVDLDKAISAEDGEILYYDPTLVEGNEDDLIHQLQDWVYLFIFRWYNRKYNILEEFNLNAFLGNFYKALPVKIMNLRLGNCNSIKAHSYYIKEFLASHDRLDDFYDYLDLRQKLWLYRNIRYLKRNSGKQETFDTIVENILTYKDIPLLNYKLVQDSEKLLEDNKSDAKLYKNALNYPIIDIEDAYEELNGLIDRENHLARDNVKVAEDTKKETLEAVSSGNFSQLPTKVLDSEILDRSNSSIRDLSNVLLTQWIHLITDNRYRAYTTITHPRSGEFMLLSVKDAFILMIYCYNMYRETPKEYISDFYIYEALREPLPNFNELRNIVPYDSVSDDLIVAFQELFNPMRTYISIEQFFKDSLQMQQNYIKQWEAYSFNENHKTRSYLENLVKRHYVNRKISLFETPTKYLDHFRNIGIEIGELMSHEYAQLATDCYNFATGNNLFKQVTISEIQAALLDLTARLSSYPLQFLRDTTLSNFHIIGMPTVRPADISVEVGNRSGANIEGTTVKHLDSSAVHDLELGEFNAPEVKFDYDIEICFRVNPFLNAKDLSLASTTYLVPTKPIGLRGVSIEVHNETTDNDLNIYED